MSVCEECGKKHSDLFIQFYVWECDGGHIDISEFDGWKDGVLDWPDTICGLTPETAVNEYVKYVNQDEGVADGDETTVWIRPVVDLRFGLQKYVVTAEIELSYTSGRVISLRPSA